MSYETRIVKSSPALSQKALEAASIIEPWNGRKIQAQTHKCKCQFIPPYIMNQVSSMTSDQFLEHCNWIKKHEKNHCVNDLCEDQLLERFNLVKKNQSTENQEKEHAIFRQWRNHAHSNDKKYKDTSRKSAEGRANDLVKIYDLKQKEKLPGKLVSEKHQDKSAKNARDGLIQTLAYYRLNHNRDSLDGKGVPLHGHVHYGKQYTNAFLDEDLNMIFGDGDGIVFEDFTIDLDVISHELTHGFTQLTADLEYQDQSGALNESISDVFGASVVQWVNHQTVDQASWLIGDKVLKGEGALRSMKNPGHGYKDHPVLGSDPQPDSMGNYIITKEDDGGVHLNSGIPNKAFYLVSMEIGGHCWEKPAHIWYDTMTNHTLKPRATFLDFANASFASAKALYPDEPKIAEAVLSSWRKVDVLK